MSPEQFKLVKTIVKFGIGIGFTFLMGKIYETGKQTEEKIDEWFDQHNTAKQDTTNI